MGFMLRWDPYTMEMNQKRNYYSCRRFGHLVRHCRNWRIIRKGRRMKIAENNYLKEKRNQDLD